jgi:hypothetical protein
MHNQPTTYCDFKMSIADAYAFEGGRTVLVGEVTSGPNYIPACDCELVVGEWVAARFRIEGEMLPLGKTRNDLRSVSTKETFDMSLIHRFAGQCTLRGLT